MIEAANTVKSVVVTEGDGVVVNVDGGVVVKVTVVSPLMTEASLPIPYIFASQLVKKMKPFEIAGEEVILSPVW